MPSNSAYRTSKSGFLYGVLLLLLSYTPSLWGQSLCNDPQKTIDNGFEIAGDSLDCSPFQLVITNKLPNATSVRYIFDYQGESLTNLPNRPLQEGVATTLFPRPFEKVSTYTILQLGKRGNGSDFYSCKKITVVQKSEPVFSYRICNNSYVELSVPVDSLNYYNSYKITWGDGTEDLIEKHELPATISRDVNSTQPFLVEGILKPGSSCNSRVSVPMSSTGSSYSGKVKIEKVELIKQDIAQITFSGSYKPDGYKLFVNEAGGTFNLNQPDRVGVMPGSFNYKVPDPSKSYCFVLSKEEPCGGTDISPDFCTTPITSIDPGVQQTVLRYLAHSAGFYDLVNPPASIGNRIVSTKMEIETINANTRSILLNPATGVYTDTTRCPKDVCYRLSSEVSGTLFSNPFAVKVLSNRICINEDSFHLPPISEAFVSYDVLASQLEFAYTTSNLDDVNQTFLWKQVTGNKELLDSSRTGQFTLPLTAFSDNDCFALTYENSCGYASQQSSALCPISLQEQPEKVLKWSLNSPFSPDSIVAVSILIYSDSLDTTPVSKVPLTSSITGSYSPDLTGFDNYAYFQVIVESSKGNLSRSERIRIHRNTEIFIADAFSPNGDGINDIFIIKGNLSNLKSYLFKVYNREGKEVFISHDISEHWTGKIQQESLPTGIYGFRLVLETQTNELIEKTGKITLLR